MMEFVKDIPQVGPEQKHVRRYSTCFIDKH